MLTHSVLTWYGITYQSWTFNPEGLYWVTGIGISALMIVAITAVLNADTLRGWFRD